MNFTKLAFKKAQFTLLTILLLCVAGFLSYKSMSRSEDPIYVIRIAQVVTSWPGASPERVEMLVTDKLEKYIQEIPEIDYIESESKTGVSVITVHVLEKYKNMRPIWDELRRKVEDAKRELPETASAPHVNDDYGDIYGIVFSIIWDGFTFREVKDIADDIRDDLLDIKQVAKVDIIGVQDERIFIDYNNDKLNEISLSPSQLRNILKERNIIQSGGMIYTRTSQIAVEPTGNYEQVKDIQDTLIQIPNTSHIVRLGDIANIYRGYIDPPKILMRTNGEESIGIAISMREGDNIITLGEKVTDLLSKYEAHYPLGIEFEMIAYQPDRVSHKISEFAGNLLQAILIVCAVMFLFLGLRTGFIVASLIPVVILITVFIMAFFKIGLNQISLASLIIALGMLVDNAIVISESIIMQMKAGKKALDAAIHSAKELRMSLLISSLTTSAAFLPIFLAESGTGEYAGSLFLVVTITLLCSWLISLTMIPILCIFFLKVKKEDGKMSFFSKFMQKKPSKSKVPYQGFFYETYRKTLVFMLKKRMSVIILTACIFLLAIFSLRFVPKIFYPPSDTPMFTAEIEMPVGSSIRRTENTLKKIEDFVIKNFVVDESRKDGVVNFATYIGYGGPRYRLQHNPDAANTHYAFMLFNVTDFTQTPEIKAELEDYILEKFPDTKAKIRPLEEGTPVDNPIEVRITGKDVNTLYLLAAQVEEKLENISGTKYVNNDWGNKGKKIVIKVDQERAKRAQITNSDIARSLESAISGISLSEFREEDELIPVILRSEIAKDVDLISTEAFNVYSQASGTSVPLNQVAEILVEWEPTIVFRRNRLKTITIFSEIQEGYTASEIDKQIISYLKKESKSWPADYKWAIGGENEESGKAKNSIYVKLPIAALLILFLLMAQFNSLKRMVIIVITIPIACIGVIIGLLVTHSYFGIMTLLGVISLAGIIINNAIVLLDRIKIEIEENHAKETHAIILAAQKRMRPILLTTITTVASLLPLWFSGGILWEPMAIAIIFGLLIGTVLTLGLVPVFYSLFFKVDFEEFNLSEIKIEESHETYPST